MNKKTLLTIKSYQENRFAKGSAPDSRTIRRMIDDGDIAGKRIGRNYYVEVTSNNIEIDGLAGGHYHG